MSNLQDWASINPETYVTVTCEKVFIGNLATAF